MKKARLYTGIVLTVILTGIESAFAEQIRLKDGTTKEGEILSQTDTMLILRVKLPGNIYAEKEFSKSDIAEIVKEQEDSVAFKKLPPALKAGSSSYKVEQYNDVISNKFLPFISRFPNSTFATNVQQRLEETVKERDAVLSGLVLFLGKWYTAKQAKRRDLDFEAYKAAAEIAEARKAKNVPAVMKQWEMFEKQFVGTSSTPLAITETTSGLAAYKEGVRDQQQSLADKKADLRDRFARAQVSTNIHPHMIESNFKSSEGSRFGHKHDTTEKTKGYTPSEEREIDSAKTFLSEYPNAVRQIERDEKESADLNQQISSKLEYLRQYRLDDITGSIADAEKAEQMVDAGRLADAVSLLGKAASSWPKNNLVKALEAEMRTVNGSTSVDRSSGTSSVNSDVLQCDKDIEEKVAPLRDLYLDDLKALKAGFQNHGDLNKVLAVTHEIERFSLIKKIDPEDLVKEPDELKGLQVKYRKAPAELAQKTAQGWIVKLNDKIRQLTIDGKLNDAMAIQKERETIQKKYSLAPQDDTKSGLVSSIATPDIASKTVEANALPEGPSSDKWTTPFGGTIEVGKEIVLKGPGTSASAALAVFPGAQGDAYSITGEVNVKGYPGFGLGYNSSDGTFVSLYSAGSGIETWSHNSSKGRTPIEHPALPWPRSSWQKFQLVKSGSKYKLTIGENTAEVSLPTTVHGSQFGLVAYFGDEVRVRDVSVVAGSK